MNVQEYKDTMKKLLESYIADGSIDDDEAAEMKVAIDEDRVENLIEEAAAEGYDPAETLEEYLFYCNAW